MQKTPNSVNAESDLSPTEYMDFEQLWEQKHKSDGSKDDLPKYGTSDFKFVTVLGKGSFGKVRVCVSGDTSCTFAYLARSG